MLTEFAVVISGRPSRIVRLHGVLRDQIRLERPGGSAGNGAETLQHSRHPDPPAGHRHARLQGGGKNKAGNHPDHFTDRGPLLGGARGPRAARRHSKRQVHVHNWHWRLHAGQYQCRHVARDFHDGTAAAVLSHGNSPECRPGVPPLVWRDCTARSRRRPSTVTVKVRRTALILRNFPAAPPPLVLVLRMRWFPIVNLAAFQ